MHRVVHADSSNTLIQKQCHMPASEAASPQYSKSALCFVHADVLIN